MSGHLGLRAAKAPESRNNTLLVHIEKLLRCARSEGVVVEVELECDEMPYFLPSASATPCNTGAKLLYLSREAFDNPDAYPCGATLKRAEEGPIRCLPRGLIGRDTDGESLRLRITDDAELGRKMQTLQEEWPARVLERNRREAEHSAMRQKEWEAYRGRQEKLKEQALVQGGTQRLIEPLDDADRIPF